MRVVDGVIAMVTGVVVVDAAVTASYLSVAWWWGCFVVVPYYSYSYSYSYYY